MMVITPEKEGRRAWVKSWVNKLHDHRFRRLNEIERYRYYGIYLCQADGLHDHYPELDELLKSIAVQIGVDAGQLHDSILRMQTLRLVNHELRITDWESEQAKYVKDPTATERKRRQREREKALPLPAPAQPCGSDKKGMSRCHAVTSRARHGEEEACSSSLKNETTTTEARAELIWPLWFDEDEGQRVKVVQWMDGLDQGLQQQLLDGFQRKMEVDPPDSPMGWLFKTVEKARTGKDGGFVPSLGLAVAARRARSAQEAADKEAAKVVAAEAEKRKSELQTQLDKLDESQVRELLTGSPDLDISQIENWLQSGRPRTGPVSATARLAISRRK